MKPGRKPKFILKKKELFKGGRGRQWHSQSSSKVCFLCLRRFDASVIEKLCEDAQDQDTSCTEDDDDCVIISDSTTSNSNKDPLGDSPKKNKDITSGVVVKVKKPNLYVRFLLILSRYLKVKTKRFRNSAERNNLLPPFCEECFHIVQTLCEVYDEWQKIRLTLFWRLSQISQTIRVSKTKVSGKLGISLLKNLSTQLRVVSASPVDILRKHIALKCSAKTLNVPPRVAVKRTSPSTISTHSSVSKLKLLYPIEHMKQYLKSLIVVFALAVKPKEPPPPPPAKKMLNHRKKKPYVSPSKVKNESGKEKKENVPPGESDLAENIRVKIEGHEDGGNGSDHFERDDYSPAGGDSGPNSPINNDADDNDDEVDRENNDDEEPEKTKGSDDSDWSMHVDGSGNDSDVDFAVNPSSVGNRRWNLRRRKTRSSKAGEGDQDEDEEDEVLPLPPLRAPRGSKLRPVVPESEKKFSCNLCSQRFRLERSLRRHLSYSHSFLVPYNCTKCNLRFKKRVDLDLHIKKVHKPALTGNPSDHKYAISTPCTVCKKVFPSKFKMMFHRKTAHKLLRKIECEICKKIVVGEYRYNKHVKSHANKPFKCSTCGRRFHEEDKYQEHIKYHEDNPDWDPTRPGPKKKKREDGDLKKVDRGEGQYKCDIPGCGRSFRKEPNLVIHKSLHDTDFNCTVCQKEFQESAEIRRHLKSEHEISDEQHHFCLHCEKGFTHAQTYDLHYKICHPTKYKICCDFKACIEEFEGQEKLFEHIKETHLTPEFEETEVELNLTIPPELNEKPKTAKERRKSLDEEERERENTAEEPEAPEKSSVVYRCSRCKWPFTQKAYLDVHMIAHTPPDDKKLFHCGPCTKTFYVVENLQLHVNIYHGENVHYYECTTCGAEFNRKVCYQRHEERLKTTGSCTWSRNPKEHGGDSPSKEKKKKQPTHGRCVCGLEFDDPEEMKKHRELYHTFRNKMRVCTLCDNTFEQKDELINHMFDAHGIERPFKCDVCGKTFCYRTQMKSHAVSHKERDIPCPLCPKMFRKKTHLDEHIRVHYQIKEHICHFCGKAFVKKSSLNLHLDIHLEIKRYKCQYCDKKFCRKNARDGHENTHTNFKPYTCDYCGKGLSQRQALKAHLKMHERLNSDQVQRRPWRKSVPVGNPIQDSSSNQSESKAVVEGVEPRNEDKPDSGIISEALQAAFNDINMELFKEDDVKTDGGNVVAGTSSSIVGQSDAYAAVEALIKGNDDNDDDNEESNKRPGRRGRQPKDYKAMLSYGEEPKRGNNGKGKQPQSQSQAKDLVCGFCGKEFKRERHFKLHVDKHMSVDSILDEQPSTSHHEDNLNSLRTSSMDEDKPHGSMQYRMETSHEISSPASTTPSSISYINSPTVTASTSHYTSSPQTSDAPSPVPEPPRKKRGRPKKEDTSVAPPGSRLARIVENVRETLNSSFSSSADLTITQVPGPNASQSEAQFNHQQNFRHPQSTPSPHVSQSGSEHSTPAGSPAPMQQQYLSQNTTTTTSSTATFPSQSFISPFLLPNPYLIPTPTQAQQPQQATLSQTFPSLSSNRIHNQTQLLQQPQQGQSLSYSGGQSTSHQNQQASYNQQSNLYHQQLMQQQQRLQQQQAPHDLSKSGFSMFFANPRS